jgi:hypothetical protein
MTSASTEISAPRPWLRLNAAPWLIASLNRSEPTRSMVWPSANASTAHHLVS